MQVKWIVFIMASFSVVLSLTLMLKFSAANPRITYFGQAYVENLPPNSFQLNANELKTDSVAVFKNEWGLLNPLLKISNYFIFEVAFIGIICVIFIFVLLQYKQSKDDGFLFYAIYVLTNIAYHARRFTFSIEDGLLIYNSKILAYEGETFLSLAVITAHIYFVKKFLDISEENKLLNWLILLAIIISTVFAIIDIGHAVLYDTHNDFIEKLSKSILTGLIIIILAKLWFSKKTLSKYIIFGSNFFFIFTLITTVIVWAGHGVPHNPRPVFLFYSEIGILGEILCFSLGLGQKSKIIQMENFQKEELEKELAKARLIALQTQLNPHFIFNSLSSIKNFIQQNNSEQAIEYLIDFSKLIRFALETSEENIISLEQELEICERYLKIESIRFDNNFEHSLFIAPDIDTSFIELPPLTIQPLIENSIEHGLSPKLTGLKELIISVKNEEGNIVCIVEDSGIGLSNSKLKAEKKVNIKKKSFGINLTRQRLKSHSIKLHIEDKTNDSGEIIGTIAKLIF